MMMMMMSAECAVDSNRKQNIDYAVKDDEKCFGAERSVGSLFAENNGRMKRDNSPGTCQQNNAVDMSNEAVDNPRINMDKKSDTNNHTMQSDANGKRQKTVCYDFKKGICRRRFCRVSTTSKSIWFVQDVMPMIENFHFSVPSCNECRSGDFLPRLSKQWVLSNKLQVCSLNKIEQQKNSTEIFPSIFNFNDWIF